jgi:hypothetical protein
VSPLANLHRLLVDLVILTHDLARSTHDVATGHRLRRVADKLADAVGQLAVLIGAPKSPP